MLFRNQKSRWSDSRSINDVSKFGNFYLNSHIVFKIGFGMSQIEFKLSLASGFNINLIFPMLGWALNVWYAVSRARRKGETTMILTFGKSTRASFAAFKHYF